MEPHEDWRSLRKSKLHIRMGMYETEFTNNLSATDMEFRTAPRLEISMDLNSNLRVRNKQTNTYYDAQQLARGKIKHLRHIQLDGKKIIERLVKNVRLYGLSTDIWGLRVLLSGEHYFDVRPEVRGVFDLLLHVVPPPTDPAID